MTTLTKNYTDEVIKSTSTYKNESKELGLSGRYNQFIKSLEFSYYGLIAMVILIGSCYGAIATMQVFENDAPLWQFVLSVSFTMASLVACIGQAPTKWVVNLFGLSLLVNTLLLVVNL